jgi:predicted RNase H-like HicB family nuclease
MMYHFKIHKEENGFWAESCELSGRVSQVSRMLG